MYCNISYNCDYSDRFRGVQLAWEKPENLPIRHNILPGWSSYTGEYSGIHMQYHSFQTHPCNIQNFFFHWKNFDIFLIFAQNID